MTPTKLYVGQPLNDGRFVVFTKIRGKMGRPLQFRRDLVSFGDGGFSWGQDDNGRNLLALSLIADAVDDEMAIAAYEPFGRTVFEFMPPFHQWRLCEHQVAAIAQSCVRRIGRAA